MSDHVRDLKIIDPVQFIIKNNIEIQLAKIVKQLNEVDASEWCFEMFFSNGQEAPSVTDDKTHESEDGRVKNRQYTDSEHSHRTHANQDSAMMRIVMEMIRCKVLPNVKKSKYTRVGGG